MEKNGECKGGKHLKKENIRSAEKKKNIEGKGGKYLKKESIFFLRRRWKTEKEKEENLSENENVTMGGQTAE